MRTNCDRRRAPIHLVVKKSPPQNYIYDAAQSTFVFFYQNSVFIEKSKKNRKWILIVIRIGLNDFAPFHSFYYWLQDERKHFVGWLIKWKRVQAGENLNGY